MAYRKPYRKPYRRTYRRRRNNTYRWTTYGNAFQQLWKDVKYVKGLLNVEYKNIDTSVSLVPDTTAVSSVLINSVGQGDDRTNRDGRSIRIKYITAKLTITLVEDFNIVRLILVCDREAENGVALDSKFLQFNSVNSLYNIDGTKRFKVLYDKIFSMDKDKSNQIHIKFNKRLGTKVKYQGTSTGIANIETNAYYLLAVSNATFGTAPGIVGYTRVRFVDN